MCVPGNRCSVNMDVEHHTFGEKLLGVFSKLADAKKCAKRYIKENFMSENGDAVDESGEDETEEEKQQTSREQVTRLFDWDNEEELHEKDELHGFYEDEYDCVWVERH